MKLNPGEIICDKCKGTGKHYLETHPLADHAYQTCKFCQGVGKLDWIEVVVGKKDIWVHTEILRTPLTAIERRLKESWTVEFNQDVKSLFSEDLFNET